MKKPRDFDKMIDLISSIDDASKPYDGPITIIKPTFESRMTQIVLRRIRMKELFDEREPWRASDPDWDRIENFLGYGNVDAPVVLIGMEEGLADKDKLKSDLLYRSTFAESVMDVYEAHLGLAKGPKLFGDRPRGQRTWRVMADLMLHFEDQIPKDKQERANRRKRYRANVLGDKHDLALLLELLPLPHGNIKQWLYKKFGRYATRGEYEAEVFDKRLEQLRGVICRRDRKAIICYGRKSWDEFKRLFPADTVWETHRRAFGEYLSGDWNGAKVTLTSHFVSRNFNSDKQLDELAAVALPPRHKTE